jgi:hypothetical protein
MTTELQETKQELLQAIQGVKIDLHAEILAVKDDLRIEIRDVKTELLGAIQETREDLGEQIQGLATHMDERFIEVDERFVRVDGRFDQIEGRIANVERGMVTKDYLDDKLADLRGDLVLLARKQNRKFESLIQEFVAEGRLTPAAAHRLLALEPFPQ